MYIFSVSITVIFYFEYTYHPLPLIASMVKTRRDGLSDLATARGRHSEIPISQVCSCEHQWNSNGFAFGRSRMTCISAGTSNLIVCTSHSLK